MSALDFMKACPICGSVLPMDAFSVADVWKDNKKQRLFVCKTCANKASRKREWKKVR